MAKDIQDIIRQLPEQDQKAIRKRAATLIQEEMTLQQLRKAREQSQQELAKKLGVKQAEVSRLERRTDMYLSTLRAYVEAMGGCLEITARFPDRKAVRISHFGDEASTH